MEQKIFSLIISLGY